MVKVTKGMHYVVCVVTAQVASAQDVQMTGQFNQQYQLQSTVMINTSLRGPCNLQCEQHTAIMFNYSITGPSSTNIVSSGQQSCSVHVPAANIASSSQRSCSIHHLWVQRTNNASSSQLSYSFHHWFVPKLLTLSTVRSWPLHHWLFRATNIVRSSHCYVQFMNAIEVCLLENGNHYFCVNFAIICRYLITVLNLFILFYSFTVWYLLVIEQIQVV